MLFRVAPEIFRDYKGVKIGVVLASNIDNTKKNDQIGELLKKQIEVVKEHLNLETISTHKHILPWRQAYKQFGAKPNDHLSSIENLIKRVLKGQELRSINALVDLYNVISLKYLLPAGGEDLDKINGNIELVIATNHEKPVILLGESEPKAPKTGEVFYKDENGAICRRWNWKEAERTKITDLTKNAILVLERLDSVNSEILESATYELAKLIKQYCGGNISVVFIDEEHATAVLQENGKYKSYITELPSVEYSLDIFKNEEQIIEKHESKEYEQRVEKVQKLRAMGIEPWPENKEINSLSKNIIQDFENNVIDKVYAISGRIMSVRLHGKTAFANLQDVAGRIQIYLRKDKLGDKIFKFFEEFIDIGDIVWCKGTPFKTKMGEITLEIEELTLESKCLRPLPEKFHGLTDIETKYRQRYLDLITNQETRERFIKRSSIIKSIRHFLDNHGYKEVETPMLHPIAGGAAARPFITHHNTLDSDFYLRIAPELYLKRLIIGGFDRVYEINRNFRNEGISTRHNPEFTMLEFYTANKDYHYAMNFAEDLLRNAAKEACGNLKVQYGDYLIDFSLPFARLSPKDALKVHANINEKDLTADKIDELLKLHSLIIKKSASLNEKIFALFEKLAESKLIQPTFIIDYPIEISPLSKRDATNPEIAARFELFIAGMELSNAFNELNDPFDQAQRFRDQLKSHKEGDEEAHQYDADYVKALEYALPATVGVGIGIDRLVMILTNTTSIKEVILFPTLKKKDEQV